MQTIIDILNAINEKNLNVSEIARLTGIPGTRIYKWLDGKGTPKIEDAGKMMAWAKTKSELFPNLIENGTAINVVKKESPAESEDSNRADYIKQLEEDRAKYIRKLEADNALLWDLVKDNQEIIKTNLNLVQVSLRSISARQIGVSKVVVRSLETVLKAKPESLVREVGKEIDQIEKEWRKHGNEAAVGR